MATPRPDRLVNRLKSITLDDASAPRLVIVRQPRGPDNSKVQPRLCCESNCCSDLMYKSNEIMASNSGFTFLY